ARFQASTSRRVRRLAAAGDESRHHAVSARADSATRGTVARQVHDLDGIAWRTERGCLTRLPVLRGEKRWADRVPYARQMPSRPIRVGVISLAAMLCAVAAAAGCAGGAARPGGTAGPGSAAGSGTPGNRASPEAAAQPAAAARSPGVGKSNSITLAFAGDVHFTGRTARLLRHPATAFGPIAPMLRSA